MATEKRLIDANALKQHLLLCGLQLNASTLGFVNKRIDEQPTVDTVEVVHGRWDHHASMARTPFAMNYDCSVCGNESAETTNYCPNCGAKMDGDGNV